MLVDILPLLLEEEDLVLIFIELLTVFLLYFFVALAVTITLWVPLANDFVLILTIPFLSVFCENVLYFLPVYTLILSLIPFTGFLVFLSFTVTLNTPFFLYSFVTFGAEMLKEDFVVFLELVVLLDLSTSLLLLEVDNTSDSELSESALSLDASIAGVFSLEIEFSSEEPIKS